MRDHLLQDKLTIHVKVQSKENLLSSYTYDDDNISPELSECLIEKAERIHPIPAKENFTINIHTEDLSIGRHDATRRIHRHFHDEYDVAKRKLQHNTRLSIGLFLFGMLAMLLLYIADTYIGNFFLITFLDVTTWVFIWGAVEVFLIDRHDIRNECAILRRLAYADVVITHDNKTGARVYIG